MSHTNIATLSIGFSNNGKGTLIPSLSTGITNSEKVLSHPTRTITCSEFIINTPSSFQTSPSIPVVKESLTPFDPTIPSKGNMPHIQFPCLPVEYVNHV